MSDSGDVEADGSSTAKLTDSKAENKKKLIRLLTVMAYVSSVSMAAVMLSMYYIFLWEPKVPEHHLRADPNGPLALRQHPRLSAGPWYEGYPPQPAPFWPYRPPPQSLSLMSESNDDKNSPSLLLVRRIVSLLSTTSSPTRTARESEFTVRPSSNSRQDPSSSSSPAPSSVAGTASSPSSAIPNTEDPSSTSGSLEMSSTTAGE